LAIQTQNLNMETIEATVQPSKKSGVDQSPLTVMDGNEAAVYIAYKTSEVVLFIPSRHRPQWANLPRNGAVI
jgi:hypothetical protein